MQTVNPENPGFLAIFDLGASNRQQGNLRLHLLNNQGEPVGKPYVGPVVEEVFTSGKDLINGLANRIDTLYQQSKALLPGDDKLKALVGFIPAPAKGGVAPVFQNLEQADGQHLTQADFNLVKTSLTQTPVSANFKTLVVNDMMGGTAAALSQLQKDPKKPLTPGTHGVYASIGGGYGISEFTHRGDHLEIRTGELGHIPSRRESRTAEAGGASVPALLKNFSDSLQLSDSQREKMVATADGRIITSFEHAKTMLPNLTLEQHDQASHNAIDEYTDAVARAVVPKVLEGANMLVLTGPVNQGLESYVNANPKRFSEADKKADSAYLKPNVAPFHKLFLTRLLSLLDTAGRNQFKLNDFHLRTDIRVADNTDGGYRLSQGELIAPEKRSNWMKLPLS